MSVQECGMGTRGAVYLFEALRDNSTLQRLSMRGNAISSVEGAADASSRFGVRVLDMSSNKLEEIPVEFIEALPADVEMDVRRNRLKNVPLEITRLQAERVKVVEEEAWRKQGRGNTLSQVSMTRFESDEQLFSYLQQMSMGRTRMDQARVFLMGRYNVRVGSSGDGM